MSSLAAVQADGYYYPPDWTPDGGSASLRARVGTKGAKGALGSKNAKLKPKQPTIRFELPFDVGCSRCDATIGKGVRFNAKKNAVGKYHSTCVWAFEMKTACCGNVLEIKTDPKNGDFVIERGATSRLGGAAASTKHADVGDPNSAKTNTNLEGTIEVELQTREDRELLMADGMARLERAAAQSAERRADEILGDAFFNRSARVTNANDDQNDFSRSTEPTRHARLRLRADEVWRDDYDANRFLRRAHRAERVACARDEAERDALGLPESVTLLPVCARDAETARRAFRGGRGEGVESVERDGEANEGVTDARLDKKKHSTRKRALVPSFDAFERERSRRRAAIRESSIFSGPGVVANESDVRDNARSNAVTLAGVARQNSPDSVSLDNFGAGTLRRQVPRLKKRAAMDGELFGIYSSPRSGARGRGYVPTASAAARAGGARGVQARHALVVAQRASPRERKGASNRARAVALAKRTSAAGVGLGASPNVEYG
jgi:coiled-coil domain-containing protein 130